MLRLHQLTPEQIEAWRQARMAEGQKIYGDRDLKRYNCVDVMEELLDCLNILERLDNRAQHQGFDANIYEIRRLITQVGDAILCLRSLDNRLPDSMCTDENGGQRIWWPSETVEDKKACLGLSTCGHCDPLCPARLIK
jgi:hypothetical protein